MYVASGKPSEGFGNWEYVWVNVSGVYTIFCIQEKITKSIAWAALYEGEYTKDTLPVYHPKGYAVELTECRRYYRKLYGDPTLLGIVGGESTRMWLWYPELSEMYRYPTIPGNLNALVIAEGEYYDCKTTDSCGTYNQKIEFNVQYTGSSPSTKIPCAVYIENGLELVADV
jgi:hypothetical protein